MLRFAVVVVAMGLMGSQNSAIAHSHHQHGAQAGPAGRETSATREFKAAHAKMMRDMAKPFTGDPYIDYRVHMIPHHQGAMDMAWVALRHSKDPWTRQAAQAILIAQQQEIAQFQTELQRRGVKAPSGGYPRYTITAGTYPDPDRAREEDETGTRDELIGKTWAPRSAPPRASAQQGARRAAASVGEMKAAHAKMMHNMHKPFTGNVDVDFFTHMIPHHQGAIDMSRVALRHAPRSSTRQSADAIITAQEREIFHFHGWLDRNGASTRRSSK
jgi:uncharacterized protein (DUF305 family)